MRLMLKLSGEALAGEKHTGFDEQVTRRVGEQVLRLYDRIDELVCRLYHLTEEDYAAIRRCTVPHFLPLSAPPSER